MLFAVRPRAFTAASDDLSENTARLAATPPAGHIFATPDRGGAHPHTVAKGIAGANNLYMEN